MPDILVRGLDPRTVQHLKDRAKQHGRSLQGEARLLLEQAVDTGGAKIRAILDGWKKRFAGRRFASSVVLIHEDRRR